MKLSNYTKLAGFTYQESTAIHAAWRALTLAYELNTMDSDESDGLPSLAGVPCQHAFHAARAALVAAFGEAGDLLYDRELETDQALYMSFRDWAKSLRVQLDEIA